MDLVERDEHFSHLLGWLTGERTGSSGLVSVEGPIGTGKTALLHAFAQRATETGALALGAVCTSLDHTVPFGVLNQLFRGSALPAWFRDETDRALAEAMSRTDSLVEAQLLTLLSTAVADLARQQPVLLTVDDARHADLPSAQILARLARRLGAARVLLVTTDRTEYAEPRSPVIEITSQPHVRRLSVGPLSRAGVTRMLSRSMSDREAERRTDEFFAATGGNPLLLNSLPHGGFALGRAVVACLRDSSGPVLDVARALAVYGQDASPSALAGLTGIDIVSVEQALLTMTAAGMLDEHGFRHPAVRTSVLDSMAREHLMTLHRQSARQLHHEGAPPLVVAAHLVDGAHADETWAAGVLLEAADHLVMEDRVDQAVEVLVLAQQAEVTGDAREMVRARLARAEWLLNPAVAARHLPELTDAADTRALGVADTVEVVRQLLWLGKQNEARARLDLVIGGDCGQIATDAHVWLRGTYPEIALETPPPRVETLRPAPIAEITAALVRGHAERVPALAGRLLAEPLGQSDAMWSVEPAFFALQSLVYVNALAAASSWCDQLTTRNTPVWQAIVDAVRADVACRRGDFPTAAAYAKSALTGLSPRAWGVAVGLPVSVLVLAYTRMGDHAKAAKLLAQVVPDAMADTRYGLHFLYARGHHHLATDRVHAALADFMACGELVARWGLDQAGIVPWRIGAAEAWLRHGSKEQARKLVHEQLGRNAGEPSRARGTSLRLLAMTSELRQRLPLLTEAMELLEEQGDQFELARVLGELARAHHDLGDRRRARMIVHRAWHVARMCAAAPLCRELLPDANDLDVPATAPDPGAVAALTRSELRVASLAAMGYTNREIAGKLFVTPSTVEQHLTRVFRKLNVRQRDQLPPDLCIQKIA